MAVLLSLFPFGALADMPGIPETSGPTIGYRTPGDAIAALRSKPGVVFEKQQDWLLATDPAERAYWAFPLLPNPAFPAAVKRVLVVEGSSLYVQMAVLCGGTQPVCDKLVADFEHLNDGLREFAIHQPGYVAMPLPKQVQRPQAPAADVD